MEPTSSECTPPDTSGLRADGLSEDQIGTLGNLLEELGAVLRQNEAQSNLTEAPPKFWMNAAEAPAADFAPIKENAQDHFRPKGRPRKSSRAAQRPEQVFVDQWMIDRAELARASGEVALKEVSVISECMATINASRRQARIAFGRLPPTARRQRGQSDRWGRVPAVLE